MTFTPAPGDRAGDYVLDERVAAGGFTTVWRAHDAATDETVAVKCGDAGDADRATVRERFHAELAAFRAVDGGLTPGPVVRFLDGDVGEDTAWVATELVDGDSVDAAVDAGALAPGPDALRTVGVPLVAALAYVHQCGVAHLDVKPANLLRRSAGPPALVDFNTAVPTATGDAVVFHHDPFKPPETSPTDLRDHRAGPWSDVYAAGLTLAYLLTGRALGFDAGRVADWAAVDPSEHGADVSAELAAAVRRATAPRPADRFGDAGALFRALARAPETGGPFATLVHADSLRELVVGPGATVGRWTPGDAVPAVVVDDAEGFVSTPHAAVEFDAGRAAASGPAADDRGSGTGDGPAANDGETGWRLVDRSVNGTYRVRGDDERFLLSADGLAQRRAADGPLPEEDPAASAPLAAGDRLVPVDPDYGEAMAFYPD